MLTLFKRGKKKATAEQATFEKQQEIPMAGGSSQSGAGTSSIEGKLLVVGRESTFSSEVIDYAIDMAKRMSFEILALNSAPLSCDSFNLLSASQSKLCQEFQSISAKNAMAFRNLAESNGIPFTHVVKYDEPEQALSSVQQEFGNIEFVISDAQRPATADQATESNRPRNEVLVYSMI